MAEIIIPDGVRYHLYAASVGQTAFAYTFPILSAADIGVKRLRAGVSTRLTLDTDYSVSGAGTQPGGAVTLLISSFRLSLIAVQRSSGMIGCGLVMPGAVGAVGEEVEGCGMTDRHGHDVAGSRAVAAGGELEVDETVVLGAPGETVRLGILLPLPGGDEP